MTVVDAVATFLRRPTERATLRASVTVVDQFLSSLSNLALSVVVARASTTEAYGSFALAYSVYAIVLGVGRALASEPLVIAHSHHESSAAVRRGGGAAGAAVVVGAAAGVAVAAVGALLGGSTGPVLVVMGVALPALLLQDALRYVGFVSRRPQVAAISDGLWLAAFLAGALVMGASAPVTAVLGWWAACGLVGAVLSMSVTPLLPSLRGGLAWLRRHGRTGRRLTAEFVLVQGGPQLVLLVTSLAGSLTDAAALRGAATLMGPAVVAAAGVGAATLPEAVRIRADRHRLRRLVGGATAAVALGSLAWGVAAGSVPSSIGEQLLGDSWAVARDIVVPLAVAVAGTTAWSALMVGFRALDAVAESLRTTIPASVLLVVGGSVGGVLGGARGAVVGMILPAAIGVGLFARRFLAVSHESRAP